MENQFIELNLAIGSYNCYGLGEHNHRRFRHIFNWQKWAMFTRDVAPIDEWNFYGQHPFIMCVEDDFAFGIYMHNSNAQEFILSPNPGTVFSMKLTHYLFYIQQSHGDLLVALLT